MYFYCNKELTGDFHCDRGMIRRFKGEKWTSRAVVKISIIVCLEYICIDKGLPAFSFSLGVNYCCAWENALFRILGFFCLNLPSSRHCFSTAWGSPALASPSLKAGTNLRKGWRTWSAVFLLLVGITGTCQELSCPRSKDFACPWSKQHSCDASRSCTALQETEEWVVVLQGSSERFHKGLVLPSAVRREKR